MQRIHRTLAALATTVLLTVGGVALAAPAQAASPGIGLDVDAGLSLNLTAALGAVVGLVL
ncbi:hypothetical protein AB0I10_02980 [Streptomyces sp. NPDC050636]|uniref:hypothetical protein n=1 Tax=Streptomyces sp. NPDC050636 TaxID=3154510 RepID=UPI0034355BFE